MRPISDETSSFALPRIAGHFHILPAADDKACGGRQGNSADVLEADFAQPRFVLIRAIGVACGRSDQHVKSKKRGLFGRGLVRFQNKVLNDHAASRRQSFKAAAQQITVLLRAQHVTDGGNQHKVKVAAEAVTPKIPDTSIDSSRQVSLADVALCDQYHFGLVEYRRVKLIAGASKG